MSDPSLPIRVYADTSVYGGVFDEEFASPTRKFFDEVRDGRFKLVTSAVVQRELDEAPASVREHFDGIVRLADEAVLTRDALELSQAYLAAGIVGPRSAEDALHVALASLADCAVLVSWNFKHIVHREKAPRYNAVNTLRGTPEIGIYSPAEIIRYEDGGGP